MAFDNPLLTGSRDEFDSDDGYLPAGWYFNNDLVNYGQVPTDIDGPPLDKWWFERFDILFNEYMKEYMKDIEGQDADDMDRIYRQEAADAWVDALIKYENGEITLEELKAVDVGVLSEMDGWEDYYEAVINDAGAEDIVGDDDEDDGDSVLDKVIDGVVTVINGVKGIFGPGGIFIPIPTGGGGSGGGGTGGSGGGSGGETGDNSGNGETDDQSGGGTNPDDTGTGGTGDTGTGDTGTGDTGTGDTGTGDTGTGDTGTGDTGTGDTGTGDTGTGDTGTGDTGTGNSGGGSGDDENGNGDVTVVNDGGDDTVKNPEDNGCDCGNGVKGIVNAETGECDCPSVTNPDDGGGGDETVKDPEDNRCDCGGYKGYKNAEGGCDCPSGTVDVDDPVGNDDGRCDCGGYKGYKDENGNCQCPGSGGYDPVGDSESKDGGDDGGVVVNPPEGGDGGSGLNLFAIPSAPKVSIRAPTETEWGPLFKVPRSRPYIDQDDGSRPIAGWLQQLGRNLK